MSKYAVIGKPVRHSKSPLIHRLFAQQTGQDMEYEAIEVAAADFTTFVKEFFAGGGAGLNITVPYKEEAFALAASCSERATLAQAVNTLFMAADGELCGDNTDGVGLVRDLLNNNVQIAGKRVVLLGAGGAARGAVGPLLAQLPARLVIANRTLARARQLQQDCAALGAVEVSDYAALGAAQFDLIINATSLGLQDQVPPVPGSVVAAGCCCYDMMYGTADTAFVRWARENGAAVALDGLGMLVEQAAEAFAIWRGVRPETDAVIRQLRG